MSSQPRIAIVGGGPAGLTMGALLHKNRIPYTIFEYREKPTEEELAQPSGMLDLHEENGLAAIRACDLYDAFLPLTGECTERFIVSDRTGKILLPGDEEDSTRPEISRNNLAKILFSKNSPESIKWGHKLLSATTSAASGRPQTELDFGSYGKHSFDLVVGADGAWSKVRTLLTDIKPDYTGMHIVTITIKEITKKYPHLAELVGSGSFSSLGNKQGIVSQRGPYDSSRIYLWLILNDEQFFTKSGLADKPATSAKEALFAEGGVLSSFSGSVKELVSTACNEEVADHPGESVDTRALYSLPHGTSWEHKPGVTVVGDAAHVMLPNGEGVNLAMQDSLLLSNQIVKAYQTAGQDVTSFQQTLDPLLQEFEADMLKRATAVGHDTDQLIGMMFGTDDAAYEFVKMFEAMMEEHQKKQ